MPKPVKIDDWIKIKEQFSQIGSQQWSVSRLLELSKDLDVFELPLSHMNLGYSYSYRPRDFVMHMKAVMDADLKYPIILDEDGEIMDGRHRIMKALYLGKKTIKAVRFDENPTPCRED